MEKALYGLKQSSKGWFGRLSRSKKEYGFKLAQVDYILSYKRNGDDIILLLVYIDDMIVMGSKDGDKKIMQLLGKRICNEGSKKYEGIEVSSSKQGLSLSKRKDLLDLLTETGNSVCTSTYASIEVKNGLIFLIGFQLTRREIKD